jgi:DNA-binding MarR family transcriptional regulator
VFDGDRSNEPDGRVGEGFDEYLFYLFVQTVNRRNRDFAPALDEICLSLTAWRAMSVINRLGGCLMSEMAEFTTVDRTTLTRTVDQLVKQDVVRRVESPTDRRQVRVELTEHGRALFDHALGALKAHNTHALRGLSAEDLTTLRALLQRILKNLVPDEALFQKVMRFER